MKIYNSSEIVKLLKEKYLFIDTNILIAFSNYEELFTSFIDELQSNNCAFTTIPSVKFEFSRTDTITNYNVRINFLSRLCRVYPIERHLDEFTDLIPVLHRVCSRMSYTDFLLSCCLYKWSSEAYLITENAKDFLVGIFDRVSILTIDANNSNQSPTGIRNLGIYKFNAEAYAAIAEHLLKT